MVAGANDIPAIAHNLNGRRFKMPVKFSSESAARLERYRSNNLIQEELSATLHNSGEEKTDYEGWLDGCSSYLEDNRDVLKEWM